MTSDASIVTDQAGCHRSVGFRCCARVWASSFVSRFLAILQGGQQPEQKDCSLIVKCILAVQAGKLQEAESCYEKLLSDLKACIASLQCVTASGDSIFA